MLIELVSISLRQKMSFALIRIRVFTTQEASAHREALEATPEGHGNTRVNRENPRKASERTSLEER